MFSFVKDVRCSHELLGKMIPWFCWIQVGPCGTGMDWTYMVVGWSSVLCPPQLPRSIYGDVGHRSAVYLAICVRDLAFTYTRR